MAAAAAALTVAGLCAAAEKKTAEKKMDKDAIINGTHGYIPDNYIPPAEPEVREKLEWFRDQKLGLMMHWGMYSQTGDVESWGLCDKEKEWSRQRVDWTEDGEFYKRQYWGLNRSFNPIRFRPEVWADIAAKNGFRYLIFTTKHHDGFCMFDSKYSDYKVTAPECPFSSNPNANIVKRVFDEFRAKGLAIAAYFSKPDWHHTDYWENHGLGYENTRMPSYDVSKNPAKWGRFTEFVRNQILELVGDYGPVDIIWLDGGQVQRNCGLDIGIEKIIADARKIRPGLIAVDRTAGGTCENVITPEQTVPPQPLAVPWESCVTMGGGFSYRYDDIFKSPRELVHLLMDIVAKGGNLALNVAPGPDGRLPRGAVERMNAMGEWLKKNGEAVYGTRTAPPYRVGEWAFTGKGGAVYATRLWNERQYCVRRSHCPVENAEKVKKIVHVATGRELDFKVEGGKAVFVMPADIQPDPYADSFKFVF
ncbi:MAG: alpha-L-fucosidase [Kiritimatiellae bacterium]|nr:alpha-L-fucosidase [Kiritimatiellia bacterium]